MSHSAALPPPDFSWLSPACRPSPEEVQIYAHLIHASEQNPPAEIETCLHEAELQLWIWRNESRPRTPRRRRTARPAAPEAVLSTVGEMAVAG